MSIKKKKIVRVYVNLDRKRFQMWIECDLEVANGRDPWWKKRRKEKHFSRVTGALRDDTKNGCAADYVTGDFDTKGPLNHLVKDNLQ